MKKRLFIAGIYLLLLSHKAAAIGLKIPSLHTLQQRFVKNGLEHIVHRTNILTQLANKNVDVTQVIKTVDTGISTFSKQSKNPLMVAIIYMQRTDIIKLILKPNHNATAEATMILEEMRKKSQ